MSSKTPPLPEGAQEWTDFDAVLTVPVRGGSDSDNQSEAQGASESPKKKRASTIAAADEEDASFELTGFEQAEKPARKTAEEFRAMIDTELPSFKERLAVFSKASKPVFPKEPFPGAYSRTKAQETSTMQKLDEMITTPASASASGKPPSVEEMKVTDQAEPGMAADSEVAAEPAETPPSSVPAKAPENMTSEELRAYAAARGCAEECELMAKGVTSLILIEGPSGMLMKREMELKLDLDQGLLTIVRHQASIRYIRLGDLIRVDAREDAADVVAGGISAAAAEPRYKSALALSFSTANKPMLILLPTKEEKAALVKVIELLRGMLKSTKELEVVEL